LRKKIFDKLFPKKMSEKKQPLVAKSEKPKVVKETKDAVLYNTGTKLTKKQFLSRKKNGKKTAAVQNRTKLGKFKNGKKK
jgi:hypothetical protein